MLWIIVEELNAWDMSKQDKIEITDYADDIEDLNPHMTFTTKIKEEIAKFPNVIGAYDLLIHNYGPDFAIGSVHLEVDNKLGIDEFHILTIDIQETILKKYDIFLTIGLYSVNPNTEKIRKTVKDILKNQEGILSVHGVFINQKEKRINKKREKVKHLFHFRGF